MSDYQDRKSQTTLTYALRYLLELLEQPEPGMLSWRIAERNARERLIRELQNGR